MEWLDLAAYDMTTAWPAEKVRQQVQIQIKYDGYLKRQLSEIKRFEKLERKQIPASVDYDIMRGLAHRIPAEI